MESRLPKETAMDRQSAICRGASGNRDDRGERDIAMCRWRLAHVIAGCVAQALAPERSAGIERIGELP